MKMLELNRTAMVQFRAACSVCVRHALSVEHALHWWGRVSWVVLPIVLFLFCNDFVPLKPLKKKRQTTILSSPTLILWFLIRLKQSGRYDSCVLTWSNDPTFPYLLSYYKPSFSLILAKMLSFWFLYVKWNCVNWGTGHSARWFGKQISKNACQVILLRYKQVTCAFI